MSTPHELAREVREAVRANQGDFLYFTVEELDRDDVTPLLAALVRTLGITEEKIRWLSGLDDELYDVLHALLIAAKEEAEAALATGGGRPLTVEERAALDVYVKEMQDVTIPAIVEATHQRNVAAQESRNVVLRGAPREEAPSEPERRVRDDAPAQMWRIKNGGYLRSGIDRRATPSPSVVVVPTKPEAQAEELASSRGTSAGGESRS